MKSIHLPGLNGIRSIAALIVLFGHIDQMLPGFGISTFNIPFAPRYGVTLFFVLSGFLITFLLLKEKESYSKIQITKFYIRRILRIWPLYFLAILVSVIMLACLKTSFPIRALNYILYVFFLPNVAFAMKLTVKPIEPLWSVGVEEQFYLIWPLLMHFSKKPQYSIFATVFVYLTAKAGLFILGHGYWLITLTRIDCMAIGGLAAWLVINKLESISGFIFSKGIQLLSWAAVLSILIYPIYYPDFLIHECYSVAFAFVLINISFNTNSIIRLQNRFWDYIGKLSYGIYIIHMPVIFLGQQLLNNKLRNSVQSGISIFLSCSILTLVLSDLSYRFFEKKFLILKEKYSPIISRV